MYNQIIPFVAVYMSDILRLTLYISGQSPPSLAARENIRRLSQALNQEAECEITIVDVFTEPETTEQARIVATPTLVKHSPPPERRIIGDLSDIARVIHVLGIENYILNLPQIHLNGN